MNPVCGCFLHGLSGFPRVSGDEPGKERWRNRLYMFSPREQG